MDDPEKTVAQKPERGRRRKRSAEPSGAASVSQLAEEFLAGLTQKTREALSHDDRTRVGSDTYRERVADPARVALLSFFLWGGGFLPLGRPLLASFVLFLVLVSAFLFLSAAGLAPSWMGAPFLRDLRWRFPSGWSVVYSGLLFLGLWWSSVVIATAAARRKLAHPYRAVRRPWVHLLCAPLPVLSYYLRGAFWRGHFDALAWIVFPVALLGLRAFWNAAPDPAATQPDRFLLGLAAAALAAGSGALLGLFGRLVYVLRELGWVQGRDAGARTEQKFVALGTFLILAALLWGAVGPMGAAVREAGFRRVPKMEKKGFPASAARLEKILRAWETAAASARGQLDLIRR